MDKQNVVNSYNGILFDQKKKRNEALIHATTWNKLENIMLKEARHKGHILYDTVYIKCPE